MKMVKSLLLGSAAGLVAVAGAQAADLPVKAAPVQYVKICSLYGAGFYYIPGTDTCIKIGGYVRAEVNFNAAGSYAVPGTLHLNNRNETMMDWRTRGMVTFDTRSQTAYGTLRSYMSLAATSDMSGTSNSGFPAPNNSAPASAYVRLYAPAAFIQFAGFTMGKTASFFDFDTNPYTNATTYWGSNDGGNGIQVWAYTAQFGGGISASVSIENGSGWRQGITGGGYVYARETWPDVVANLRVDQAWGSAQIMGAIHDVTPTTIVGAASNPSDKTGFALGAGLRINLPSWGQGDYVIGQVAYADGAMRYLTANAGTGTLQTVTKGLPITVTALGPMFDAVVTGAPGSAGLDLTKGWSLTAGYEHRWNPQWKTSLWGDIGSFKYSSAASAVLGFTDADFTLWQVGSRTVWTPVSNLDLSVEIMYNKLNTVTPLPGVTGIGDIGWVSGMVRAQRNFWP
jgi:hypothetical protein